MKKSIRKIISIFLVLAMVITICPQMQIFTVSAAESNEPYCISAGRPVYVSSGKGEEYAVDGDFSTRWESGYDNTVEWMYVDLGKKTDLDHIYLEWENAYAKSYKIQISDDEENWRDVYSRGNTSEPEETESHNRQQCLYLIHLQQILQQVGTK